MTPIRRMLIVLCFAALVAAGDRQRQRKGSAKKAFEDIRTAAQDLAGLKKVLSRAIRRVTPADQKRLAAQLSQATILRVTEKGDMAVVRFRATGDEQNDVRELILQNEGNGWKLTSTTSFLTAGASLDKRNGNQPASARLKMRTTNGPYGASAYSFTYVTGDAIACKNRINLWFCHNEDFHANGGVIASLGKKSLGRVKGLPADATWDTTARVKKGHTYVLRCGPIERHDFFVVFTVKKLRKDVVEIEWKLLSDGRNAPPSIRKPFLDTIQPGDGADGSAGLCGKNG